VNREDQDQWALRSHRRAAEAWEQGRFEEEIVPVRVERDHWEGTERHVQEVEFSRDELVRPDTSLEKLAKLRPAFKVRGSVTAGNASPYSDGAAALTMTTRERARWCESWGWTRRRPTSTAAPSPWGHPLGATGAKLATQLIHELRRRGGGMGLATMCVGGGMGAAGIFEVYGA
jgi:acetyl-CoA acetyltransferase